MPHGSIFILQKAFIELFENFIYHNKNIFTGGAYAPYAPCMGTPLAQQVMHNLCPKAHNFVLLIKDNNNFVPRILYNELLT